MRAVFPNRCDTRPHYGLSGGRAMYCAQHMKPGMVHLLKEQLTREKEAVEKWVFVVWVILCFLHSLVDLS